VARNYHAAASDVQYQTGSFGVGIFEKMSRKLLGNF
jgi:hypothetical protein